MIKINLKSILYFLREILFKINIFLELIELQKKQLERCQLQLASKGTGIAHYEYRAMPMPLVSRLRLHRSKQLILHGANYRISRCRDSKTVEDELQTQQTTNYRINRRRSTELADGKL